MDSIIIAEYCKGIPIKNIIDVYMSSVNHAVFRGKKTAKECRTHVYSVILDYVLHNNKF